MNQLTVQDLSLGYEGVTVAKNISFTVNRGDFLCVVGENGSGKSTLIKGLLHLHPPTSGTISYRADFSPRQIGYLPQQTPVQRDFPVSVEEIVLSGFAGRMGLRPFYSKEERARAQATMERLGIAAVSKRCYRELSGGQQQRVLLARALCATEEMLLLDEPTAGLDPHATEELYRLAETLNKQDGLTVMMVTHDLGALRCATHVLHVNADQTFFGTIDEYRVASREVDFHD